LEAFVRKRPKPFTIADIRGAGFNLRLPAALKSLIMCRLALIAAMQFLAACGYKDDDHATEPNAVVATVPVPTSVAVQSSGSIHHVNQSDLKAVRRRGHNGDKAAVEQLIDYYMFSADSESGGEILSNLTRWLDKGISLGVAGADQKLLVVATKRFGPSCSRIRQIVERLSEDDRVNFPQSSYVRACLTR
jgi:hypothetical protein